MTHELKTPISTISLACEALKDRQISLDDDRRDNYVEIINDENSRLSLLVDNVLKSAVWDSNSLKLNYEKVNVHPIIQKVADSFKILLEKKSITLNLELEASSDLWKIDQIHFSNVIFNLVDNALKYSPEKSSIIIRTKNYNNQLWISVIDKGIGISAQNQKRIFDKFYRVSTGNLHDVKGFGLGLNYVKNMVNQFGGEIILKSKEGKGTSITIKLLQDE
jgi:two-component system phosphate regulon sensor histidine kinase PhoR